MKTLSPESDTNLSEGQLFRALLEEVVEANWLEQYEATETGDEEHEWSELFIDPKTERLRYPTKQDIPEELKEPLSDKALDLEYARYRSLEMKRAAAMKVGEFQQKYEPWFGRRLFVKALEPEETDLRVTELEPEETTLPIRKMVTNHSYKRLKRYSPVVDYFTVYERRDGLTAAKGCLRGFFPREGKLIVEPLHPRFHAISHYLVSAVDPNNVKPLVQIEFIK